MELLQLRYFQAVARLEHVTEAAYELHVAQPTLSRAIGRLEAELGVPLFDRQGRHVRLNRYGNMLLRHSERALGALEDARRELTEASGLEHGRVTIATETLLLLTGLLARFLAEHSGVRFQVLQSSPDQMIAQLRSGEADLCLASQPLSAPGLQVVELMHEDVLLATPTSHRLAGRKHAAIARLADEPFITTRPGHWLRALAERVFDEAGIKPTLACEADEPAAIRPMISAGLGIGLLPVSARQATAEPIVHWMRLRGAECQRTLRLAWRDDAFLSMAAQRFRAVAQAHFDNAAPMK